MVSRFRSRCHASRIAALRLVPTVLLFALAVALAACQGDPVTITGTIGAPRPGTPGTSGAPGTATSGGSIDARLVGRWSRTLLFQDNLGSVHASRTSWRFGADASASRAVVATNLTFGMIDSVVTFARWRVEGGAVVLTYLPEGRGADRFDYFLQGTTLVLGGIGFERQ